MQDLKKIHLLQLRKFEIFLEQAERVQNLFWSTWIALRLQRKTEQRAKGYRLYEFKATRSFCEDCR